MNKIEKLELKHLCGYLPYGLEVFSENSSSKCIMLRNLSFDIPQWILDKLKPLLLPLSALTEQLQDGSIPIVELAKILYNDISWTGDFEIKDNKVLFDSYESFNQFWYNEEDKEFFCEMYDMKFPVFSLRLFDYLYSKHFDIYGLIESGLAIDKRTI